MDGWDRLELTPATRAYLRIWVEAERVQVELNAVIELLEDSEPETAYRLYLSQRAVDLDQQIDQLEKDLKYWERRRLDEARDNRL